MRKFAVVILFAFVASLALAQVPGAVPFSGDLTMKAKGGETMNGKMYFSGTKMRWDMNAAGHQSIMINDIPGKVSYMVMPQQKMYMEMRAGQQSMHRGPKMPDLKSYDPTNPCSAATDMTCEKVGTETVNGRTTDKWLFKNKKDGSTMTVWLDKKIHFPIRTQTNDATIELNNIQEGMPAASLFEIPSGYQKFSMGGMMGGQMPQMPTGKDDE
ncbi:MAG TPA: DUF4412 domain-containing protein [Terriglobales bacterium]|nr:DUF4412 domain-containing protein [Terriglobales bacterium]